MDKNKKSLWKKIGACILGGLVVAGAGFASGMWYDTPDVIEKEVIKEIEVPVEVEKEVIKEVEVEKIVEVDNDKLPTVLEYVQENFDDFDVFDVDDDELNLIVDYIVFENDARALAEALVKEEGIEYMDDEEDIFGEGDLEEFRDNDVYKFTIEEDDTFVDDIDYEDKEAYINVRARMKLDNDDDKISRYVNFLVEVENDKAEIIDAEVEE